MLNIIYELNKKLSQKIINKTANELWYAKELEKSWKEFKGWQYEKDLK
jgi:hypothetical protein